AFRRHDIDIIPFEHCCQRKKVPDVVVYDQHILAGEDVVLQADILDDPALFRGELAVVDMQVQDRFLEQVLERVHALQQNGIRRAIQMIQFLFVKILCRIDDHRRELSLALTDLSDQLDTGDVRQSIVEDNAIELLHVVLLQRRFAIGSDRDFDIFAPQHLADLGRIEFVVFDQQDPPHFLFMERENVVEKLVERLIFQRFQQEAAGAPFQRERTVLFAGDQMDRNMPVVQIVTQQVQHLPAARIGKLDVQGNGNRREPVDKIEDLDIVRGDDSLQVMLMGLFDDDLPESQVVLDDQDDLVALLDAVAIVAG